MREQFTNPFPGMNPYLESVPWWREIHNTLISEIRYFLREALPINYLVTMEERATVIHNPPQDPVRRYPIIQDITIAAERNQELAGVGSVDGQAVTVVLPDVYPAYERYIHIRTENRSEVITIIEILSPTNKHSGRGRDSYLQKRNQILNSSATHLVEIDLLRDGDPMPVIGYDGGDPYRLMVSRNELRPSADLYPFALQSEIPEIRIPLLNADDEPILKLGEILNEIYSKGYLGRGLDYQIDPSGPLSQSDRKWIDGLLREKGLRSESPDG